MDEIRKRWMYTGICQLPLSLYMGLIGFKFEDLESCSIDNVTLVLKIMGLWMLTFATICIGHAFSTDCDNDISDLINSYWPIIIFFAVIQFGLQIWASIVVFGSVSNWQSNDKSANYFCEKTPFISLIVICIIEWVLLGIMVFKLYRKYANSRKRGDLNEQNSVHIALIDTTTNRNHTNSENEN